MTLATADTASMITDADCEAFDRDGYLIKRGLFSDAEVELLQQALATDEALQDSAFGLDDGYGGQTIVAVWNHPGDDTLGIVGRLPRIAGAAAKLLGGEVYHYPLQDHVQGAGRWRHLGLAPGLRLLVQERPAVPEPGERGHRRQRAHRGERDHAGAARQPPVRAAGARHHGRPERRRHRQGGGADAAPRGGVVHRRAGRCLLLPLQHPAHLGAQRLRRQPGPAAVLLQPGR